MDLLNTTFKDYQSQYDTLLPIKGKEALQGFQARVHRTVTAINEAFSVPEFLLRVIEIVLTILSLIPSINLSLEGAMQYCREAKNLSNLVKGLKSIEGFLNFRFSWRGIVLNVSGMTLFMISGLSLLERLQYVNLCSIKSSLAVIPVFGILPYGGLLSLSIVGLIGTLTLVAWEKQNRLDKEEARIEGEKLLLWSHTLELSTVQLQEVKSKIKVVNLKQEVMAYEALIQEGEEVKGELQRQPGQTHLMYSCRKALDDLNAMLKNKEEEWIKCEKKRIQWKELKRNCAHLHWEELENVREAKEKKWRAKLNQVKWEKRGGELSRISHMMVLSRQALVMISVATGHGIVSFPLWVNVLLDSGIAGCGIAVFLIKKLRKG